MFFRITEYISFGFSAVKNKRKNKLKQLLKTKKEMSCVSIQQKKKYKHFTQKFGSCAESSFVRVNAISRIHICLSPNKVLSKTAKL